MKTSIKTLLAALTLSTTVAFAGPGSEAKKPVSFATGIYASKDGALNVNIDKKAPVYAALSILNESGEVLVRESLSRKQDKASYRFDMNNLPDGTYTVAIISKGEKQTVSFSLSSKKEITRRTLTLD
jgi:flagellar hook assembly protein FlgD